MVQHNPNKQLDEYDKKIISLLMEDGRISYVDLANKVGLSRVAVRDRVYNLKEKGVIEKFTIAVDSEKFGKKYPLSSRLNVNRPT